MTKEAIQSFSLRVTQANQSELTVITYEIFLDYLNEAKKTLKQKNREEFVVYNKKAQVFLGELMAALNYENPVSFNLIKIYTFVNRQLIKAMYSHQINDLDVVSGIMEKLLTSFTHIAETDSSPCVMANTQQVYAGLTYGKGYLNETCLENEPNRGFRA